jgi:hypothetical protein
MKETMWRLPALLLLTVMVVGLATTAMATGQAVRYFAGIYPVELPEGGGIATLELRMYEDTMYCKACRSCCNEDDWKYIEVAFMAEKSAGITFVGDTLWSVRLDDEHRAETRFQVELQPHDTSMLRMLIRNETGRGAFAIAWFVTTPDTTEFWHHRPGPTLADRLNRKPDTTLYRAWINLSDTVRRRVFLEQFEERDSRFGTPVPVGDSGIYHFLGTRHGIEHLMRERWDAGFIDTPPPLPKYKTKSTLVVDTLEGDPPVKNPNLCR